MSTTPFKILRCPACGWQQRSEEPTGTDEPCGRTNRPCNGTASWSKKWYIKVKGADGKPHLQAVDPQKRKAEAVIREAGNREYQEKFFPGEVDDSPLFSVATENVWKRKWSKNRDGKKSKRLAEIIQEIVGDIQLSQWNEEVYDTLMDTLDDRELEGATINRYRSSLRTILRRHKIPYDFIEMTPERWGRIRVITHKEEDRLLELFTGKTFKGLQAHYPQMVDLLPCLIDTGTRTSEMLYLPWHDVDFDSGLITIWYNKTDEPRSFPMTKRVREILQRRKDDGAETPWTLNIDQLERIWKWAKEQIGLKDDRSFKAYCTRHTCATRLVANGIDIYKVKKWLGHRNIRTTERYAHLDPELLADAAKALEFVPPSTNRQQAA